MEAKNCDWTDWLANIAGESPTIQLEHRRLTKKEFPIYEI